MFATFALRAAVSIFALSRFRGASVTMIDRHYGRLAREGREHAIRFLDTFNAFETERWTLVDAAWTSLPPIVADRENGNSGQSRVPRAISQVLHAAWLASPAAPTRSSPR